MTVRFEATEVEAVIINKIVDRNCREYVSSISKLGLMMAIEACHCNGSKLDLEGLLNSDSKTFRSDILGIHENIDKTTGKLKNGYTPKCLMK